MVSYSNADLHVPMHISSPPASQPDVVLEHLFHLQHVAEAHRRARDGFQAVALALRVAPDPRPVVPAHRCMLVCFKWKETLTAILVGGRHGRDVQSAREAPGERHVRAVTNIAEVARARARRRLTAVRGRVAL